MTAPEHSKQLPALLYHYTSGNGLLGILQSSTLWATDVGFLNDTTEFSLGRAELSEMFLERADEISRRPPRDELDNSPSDDSEFVRSLASLDDVRPPYVTCFSEAPDLLSQWRSYGDTGYCVGFDAMALRELPPPPSRVRIPGVGWEDFGGVGKSTAPSLYPIRYGTAAISAIVEQVREHYRTQSAPHTTNWSEVPLLAENALAIVKHDAFEEEREWRLVLRPPLDKHHYRVDSHSSVVPYYPILFPRDAVKEVWIGPDMHERSEESVGRLLRDHEYELPVRVERSRAPYRR